MNTFIYLAFVLIIIIQFLIHYKKIKQNAIEKKYLSSDIEALKKAQNDSLEEISEMTISILKGQNNIKFLEEKFNHSNETIISLKSEIKSLNSKHLADLKIAEKKAREDAIKRSRSVIRGQASEHLAPFVIKNTNPKDYRFMGNPVDYICFEGLSDLLDGVSDKISTVRFVDIKTGKSSLNKSQRRIRDAIKNNQVSFEVINLDEVIKDDKKHD